MGLLDEIKEAQARAPRPGPRCRVGLFLESLDEVEQREMQDALDARDLYNHGVIAKVLQARGCRVKEDAIGRHRGGKCSCDRRD